VNAMRPSIFVVAALTSAALTAAGCSKPQASAKVAQPSADAAITVTVAPVEVRPMSSGLSAPGLLVSREEAAVSTQLTGYRVAQVLVDQDQLVRAGQPVARLDDTLLRTQIAQQRAVVAQQQVAADRAKQEAQRVAGLDNAGVLSQEQIVERRLGARSAASGVGAVQAQLDDLNTREGLMTVRAPVSGRVLDRTVRPGDIATPAMVMFRIARDGLVELNAEVAEADLARVKPGDRATVELPSGAQVQGVVRLVSPQVDATTKLGHARILLPLRPDLRPGGYGRAVFASAVHQAPAAPEAAIRYDADGASVMVVGADDRVSKVAVRTGSRSNGYVELLQGPPPGSRVALGGSSFVLQGDKVHPVPAGGRA